MKMTIFLFLFVSLSTVQLPQRDAVPPPPATGTGTITGRITIADAKPAAPVRRARVTLTGGALRQPEITDTDVEGRFRFTGLPGGTYRVVAAKPGFVTMEAGASRPGERPAPLTLTEGTPAVANIAMPRGAAIEGLVQDDSGEPLSGIVVSVVRFRQASTGPVRSVIRETRSDDLGRYRLHSLAPGDYIVEATPDPRAMDQGGTTPGEQPKGMARTFYPGTVQMHEARRVSLTRGQEVGGADFVVHRVPVSRLVVKITDAAGKPAASATLRIRAVGGLPATASGGTTGDGTYQLFNVPPGDYWLLATARPSATAPLEYGALRLTVAGQDLMDLTISTKPGAVVEGRVEAEGGALPDLRGIAVTPLARDLEYAPPRPAPPPATIAADGAFRLNGLHGAHFLRLSSLPDGWAIKSVTVDDKDASDTAVEFVSGTAAHTARLVLTPNTGVLEGSVRADGQAVRAYQVIVFPQDERLWHDASRFVRVASPRADGSFRVSGLLAAEYLVAAVAAIDDDEWKDPAVLRRLVAAASPVRVDGARPLQVSVNLQVLR